MYVPIHQAPHGRYRSEIAWLRRLHGNGSLIAAVCSGTVLLAEAGLLDDRQCSSHWAYRDLFRREYPRAIFRANTILDLSSERDRVITAGGVTSWQDLALYVIARCCGKAEALKIAKVFLLSGHEDGQLPFAAMNRRLQTSDAVIGQCQAWIARNYSIANPVSAMTARSGLKPRTFARRFRAATGYQPIDYVHVLRMEEAKQIIESGVESVDQVGFRVGYEDPAFFRRLFKRVAGLTPAAYRRKYTGILRTIQSRIAAGAPR
jgi:transcriptional regulator GlxA family with amidase domain